MDRHGVRYVFEHKMLPGMFFEYKAKFVGMLIEDKSILFDLIDDLFQDEKLKNPYKKEDFCIEGGKVAEGTIMIKIIFPEPEEEPLCYCSYLFFDEIFENVGYYCIEKGSELSENYPFVCSWTKDGVHMNHGNCTFENHNDFSRCLELYLKQTGVKGPKTLFDELKRFSDVGFRDIYQKFIYIHCRDLLDEIFPGEIEDEITGLIAYCYIDHEEGISFRPFMLGIVKEDSLQVFDLPHVEDTIYVLRLRDGQAKMSELHQDGMNMYLYAVDPNKYQFFDLEIIKFDTEFAKGLKESIDENYYPGEEVEDLRTTEYEYLDTYRHPCYPDDVETYLYSKENGIESVWVRLQLATPDNHFFGILLNEPFQEKGCHKGDLIELVEQKGDEGSFLVFTGRIALQKE